MRRRTRISPMGLALGLGLLLGAAPARAADDDPPAASTTTTPAPATPAAVPPARRVVEPIVPALPGAVVLDLQSARYAEAAAALATLAADAKTPEADRAYLNLVRAIALRLAGKLDDAREALRVELARSKDGPWAAKLRSEQVAVELAAGAFAAAEPIARAEADRLLAGDRKDRLAAVFQGYARRLLKPDEPTTPADPEGAFAMLAQARELAKGPALRATLLRQMGEASLAAGNPGRAIENFQQYVKEYPRGADRTAVREQLGDAQLAAGQALPARLTWTDLARDLEKSDAAAEQQARGRAFFKVSRTYGFPTPPDDTSLNLGAAALRRLVEAYPDHPLAVAAAFDIAAASQARGRSEAALAAFRAFLAAPAAAAAAATDEARAERARLMMAAQYQVAAILQGQQAFDQAIEEWRAYLAKYPNGPQSAEAQRAIVDTQLLIAQDFLSREKYDEARRAWQAFAAANPLDGRVPQVLFDLGQSFAAQEEWAEAVAAWETLAGKFPGTEPAAHAVFAIADVQETRLGRLAEAIERFRKVDQEPWASQARQRVAVMEGQALAVVTPRAFRTGEAPHLKISTRNLESLTFTAYRLDPEAYFRKKNDTTGVEALDIGLVQPDAEWTAAVPGYEKYAPIEEEYPLDELAMPGVYVVKVTDEKTFQATTLVLGSDLDAIVKVSRDQLLVFAQDMRTGRGIAGARVLVSDGQAVLAEARTGADGVLLQDWPEPRNPGQPLTYLVLNGPHVAGSGLGVPGQVAQGLSARAYLYTDRPAYRPGQAVELRGVVREVDKGQYANPAGATYRLEVYDARGRQFQARPVVLSEFGTFAATIALDPSAAVGTYRVRLFQPGKSDFAGTFEVQRYQLQKITLELDLPRTVYYRGEEVSGKAVARYQYGTPLAGHDVEVALPDGRVLRGKTTEAGEFPFAFPTEGFAEEQALSLAANLTQDGVSASAAVQVAIRAFRIDLATPRDVYLDGESFALGVTTTDALGVPTGQALTVSVLKRVEQAGRTVERQVSTARATTDAKTGRASIPLKVEDEAGGSYVVRAAGTDRFGNPIVTDRLLTISGEKDEQKLRLLSDRLAFEVGEEARLNLHSRLGAGPVLVTWEADRILKYALMETKAGDNALAWPVEGAQFPNFTLNVARMEGTGFHRAQLDLRVERDLRVEVRPTKAAVGPGEEVTVEVRATDQRGEPVSAELSLALVDTALLRLYGDRLPAIHAFFYDQTRTGAFATEATNTFRYAPPTQPVAEALVEEMEITALRLADAEDRADVTRGAIMSFNGAATTLDRAPGGPAGSGGMGGGMGGMGGYGVQAGQTWAAATPSPAEPMAAADMPAREGAEFADALESVTEKDAKAKSELGEQSQEMFLGRAAKAAGVRRMRAGRDMDTAGRMDGEPDAPRQQFVETAYWNPSVKTAADGTGRVTFRAPTALSEYRFTARGATGADTLVGQATADLAVRKDFFVDVKLPSVLTEGDRPRFSVQLHHRGVAGKAEVALVLYAAGREQRFPKSVDLKGDGVEAVEFEPFDVPAGDALGVRLEARAGDVADTVATRLPIRPWGVQAFATASGTASDDASVQVALPAGRAYESPEMLVVLSPSLRRLLVELALGQDFYVLDSRLERCILPPPPPTVVDRASELLAAASALQYLRVVGGAQAPEATRLADKVRAGVGELVTLQNDDGGWPWVPPGEGKSVGSDRLAGAAATWALAEAERLGLATDTALIDRAVAWLAGQYGQVEPGDADTRAALLHALSTRRGATFEQANGLNRQRQDLSDAALAHLALTFANLERPTLAAEVLGVLGPRAKAEAPAPGAKNRFYWEGGGRNPSTRSAAEATALAALAYARALPADERLPGAVEWLLAHRTGLGWQPPRARGPALAALGAFYGRARAAEDRYRLRVTVNDKEVYAADVQGATEGQAVRVPLELINAGGPNRVHLDLEGRGQVGYAVTLTGFTRDLGPDQDRANRPFGVNRRVTWAPVPELDGKPLPTGFSVAVNPQTYENTITQLGLGVRTTVSLEAWHGYPDNRPAWERDFLVLEETLPAGAVLVEGSVASSASYHEYGDGVLRLYFPPDQWPNATYEIYGYLPGQYRVPPAVLRGAYDAGRYHLGPEGTLTILRAGEASTDAYKPTPDELYHRGKGLFDAGRVAESAAPLEALWAGNTLRDDVAKDVARMLLTTSIQAYDPNKVVKYFEVLKERAPELVIPFDDIRVVGRAYADIGEHERAYLVWRATGEASYLEDARVGAVLRQRGRTLEGLALLLELWREYPNTAAIRNDFFGLSSLVAGLAAQAGGDPALRRELARADVSRAELTGQQIRLLQGFLALSPDDPVADEASLALLGAFLDLEDFPRVVELAGRYAALYPKSTYVDSFLYTQALGHFHLGQYEPAIGLAERIAAAVTKDAAGVEQPSPNKWQALYILGQIHDARREPAKAVGYYKQVADRFGDAASAVADLTRQELRLPEVAVVRPDAPAAAPAAAPAGAPAPAGAAATGLRSMPVDPQQGAPAGAAADLELTYRNLAEVELKVYAVDLLRLYLTRRNLDAITGIDLAGIKPLVEQTIPLGDGQDFAEKVKGIDLPLEKEGAYLVMARGGSLYASGIVLVSPLELEVLEEAPAGRVRVRVVDARTRALVPKVQVKVIGSDNPRFFSGETDLRGVFVAEGVRGTVSAVARKDAAQYAFYRGKTYVGQPPVPETNAPADTTAAPPQAGGGMGQQGQALDVNVRMQNSANFQRQIERLEQRYNAAPSQGVQVDQAR